MPVHRATMTKLILYYAPTACSIAPHIALEEVGVPFEPRRIDLAKGEQSSPEFLALSPLGRVPAMIIDGEAVTEVPALLTYVASLDTGVGLTPPPAPWRTPAASNGSASSQAASTSRTPSSGVPNGSCPKLRLPGNSSLSRGVKIPSDSIARSSAA